MERPKLSQEQLEFCIATVRMYYAKMDKEYGGYTKQLEMCSQFEGLVQGGDGFYSILGPNPAKLLHGNKADWALIATTITDNLTKRLK